MMDTLIESLKYNVKKKERKKEKCDCLKLVPYVMNVSTATIQTLHTTLFSPAITMIPDFSLTSPTSKLSSLIDEMQQRHGATEA